MQFFSAAASLCLASMAMAAPAHEVRQDATAVGTINASLNALAPTLPTYEVAIRKSISACSGLLMLNSLHKKLSCPYIA